MIYSKICSKKDLKRLLEIVNSNTHMYGINLELTSIREEMTEKLKEYFKKPNSNFNIVGTYLNDELRSFAVQYFWKSLPAFSLNSLFSDQHKLDTKIIEDYFYSGVAKSLELAEQRDIYTCYTVVRYSTVYKRVQQMFCRYFPEYIVSEIEIIEPFKKSNYEIIRNLTQNASGLNEKPLVALQISKPIVRGGPIWSKSRIKTFLEK